MFVSNSIGVLVEQRTFAGSRKASEPASHRESLYIACQDIMPTNLSNKRLSWLQVI
jgi:hypothetical protein